MKILIYGAGVIGTLYAAKLRDSGNQVAVLARGERLRDIRRLGLVLENVRSGDLSKRQVDTVERLAPDDQYDVALITVRYDQLADIIPELKANHGVATLLFMLNNPTGSTYLAEALGRDRILLGFPGAGGTLDGHVMRYALVPQQKTTIGELSGRQTARVRELAGAFRSAGFATTISRDMDAWLKAHAFFVTAICGAIYLAGGDCHKLSEDNAALALMTRGVREGFASVRALGFPVTPVSMRVLFTWLPSNFVVFYWRRFFASKMSDYIFCRHARSATYEMCEIANECRTLLERSTVEAPALRQLYRAIDAFSGHEWQFPPKLEL